jgi:4-hydroxybenzoate-CoA ligase
MINANAALYFVDRHLSERRMHKTAFISPTASLTYGDFVTGTQRFAAGLTRAGLAPQSRIALLMLDSVEFCIAFWGAIRAGVIPIPLNTALPPELAATILADCQPAALFLSACLAPPPNAPALTITTGAPWEDFLTDGAAPPVEVAGSDIAFWLYSSGSTSAPKGVRHRHASLRATADTYGANVLKLRETDLVFSAAKMFFAYGLGNSMTFPLAVGATALLHPAHPNAGAVVEFLNVHEPTVFFGVPTLYAGLLKAGHPARRKRESGLRRCISAGEALPAHIAQGWEDLTGLKIFDGIGSTEMLHIFLSNSDASMLYGSSGVAVPGYSLRIIDEYGSPAPDGEAGELLVKGPSAAADYWNQPAKSAATFVNGWVHTGDKYIRDTAGFYHYCGRTDDIFKVSGIWVSPFEVESALGSHPAVLEAAVVGHTDADRLIKPRAFVVLHDNYNPSEELAESLQAYVKAKIGPWKYPRWIEFTDQLPKTATGKIQRFRLRQAS